MGSSRVRPLAVAVVVAGLLCGGSVADATTLTDTLADLRSALQARAAASAGTEAAKLTAADAALAQFTPNPDGTVDTTDVAAVLKAGKALGQSNTADGAVLSAGAAFVLCLVDVAEAQEAQILQGVQGIYASATQTKYRNKLSAARAVVSRAAGLAATDPVRAISTIRGALQTQAGVSRKVTAVLTRLQGAGVLFRHSDDLVLNPTKRVIRILRVEANVDVTPQTSAPFRVTGDISALAIGSYRLPYDLQPDRFFDYDNALGYAISDVIGSESASYRGAVRLVLQGHPPVDLPVSR